MEYEFYEWAHYCFDSEINWYILKRFKNDFLKLAQMKKVKSESIKKKKINNITKQKPIPKKSKSKNKLTKLKYQIITMVFVMLSYFSGFT